MSTLIEKGDAETIGSGPALSSVLRAAVDAHKLSSKGPKDIQPSRRHSRKPTIFDGGQSSMPEAFVPLRKDYRNSRLEINSEPDFY